MGGSYAVRDFLVLRRIDDGFSDGVGCCVGHGYPVLRLRNLEFFWELVGF